LWNDSDTEVKEARLLYEAEQNCVKINIRDFYSWLSLKCPLFDYHFSWNGISNRDIAKEMIEYMKFKLGVQSNEE
jgi:hypothetical protein